MILRLSLGALVCLAAACTTQAPPALEADAPVEWTCREPVREAAAYAYAMARHRDDQRAVMLFPAGPAMAAYEAETKRLRDEGARMIAALKEHDPAADALPPLIRPPTASLSDALVADKIEKADACLNRQPEALSACGAKLASAATYANAHAATRTKRMEVMRFASEASMNAYVARTTQFRAKADELASLRTAIEAQYGLASAPPGATFDTTTDEEADQRIADAESCAAPLVK